MTCGLPTSAVPASIHCDHLIQALDGAEADLKVGPGVFRKTLPSTSADNAFAIAVDYFEQGGFRLP